MKEGWEETTLGKIVAFRGGGTPSTSESSYWNGNIPWVSPKDMKSSEVGDSIDKITLEAIENSAASLIPTHSILVVVRSGILNRTIPVAITTRQLAINQDIKALCPRQDVDPRYLHYFVQMAEPDILKLVTRGATVHRLSMDSLKALRFPKPPLAEQQRIIDFLDETFVGVAKASTDANKNLKNAHEIFDSYLNSILNQKHQGWVEKRLSEVSDFEGGSQPPKSTFVRELKKGYVRLLQIRDFRTDKHAVYIPNSAKNRICSEPDIMIGRYGASVGKILGGKSGAYNVALIKAIPKKNLINNEFLFLYLQSSLFQVPLSRIAARSAQAGFSKEDIGPFIVPLPSLELQQEIVKKLKLIKDEVRRLETNFQFKLERLADLRQSILHAAFAGELALSSSELKEAAA